MFPQSRGHAINLQEQGSSMPSSPSPELANDLSLRVQRQDAEEPAGPKFGLGTPPPAAPTGMPCK